MQLVVQRHPRRSPASLDGADIDADATPQSWGYKKGPAIPGAENLNNGGTCDEMFLMVEVVGPCDGNSGQSVF